MLAKLTGRTSSYRGLSWERMRQASAGSLLLSFLFSSFLSDRTAFTVSIVYTINYRDLHRKLLTAYPHFAPKYPQLMLARLLGHANGGFEKSNGLVFSGARKRPTRECWKRR